MHPDNNPIIRAMLIKAFPNLDTDPHFNVTSDRTPNYNCIAWAGFVDDTWWQPDYNVPYVRFDGVKIDWPFGAAKDTNIFGLIDLFRRQGYQICNDATHEVNIRKVALYCKEDMNWTHASRTHRNGIWTSKLGPMWDIEHGSPESIENDTYGKARFFMQKSLI